MSARKVPRNAAKRDEDVSAPRSESSAHAHEPIAEPAEPGKRGAYEPIRLAHADTLADLLVQAVTPIRITVARSASDRDAIFRLRYQVTIDEGWGQPDDYPDGRERDRYDDDSQVLHLAAWDGAVLAGTARLVFPSGDRSLPTETAYALTIEPHGQVVDGSRTAVAPAYRRHQRSLFVALLAACWLQVRGRGFDVIAGAASAKVLELHRAIGFTVDILGASRLYCGEERYPIRFDMASSVERLERLL